MTSSNDYIEHLKLLADKHKEQTSLFYERHNLFIAYNTFLIGALVLLVAKSSELPPYVVWKVVFLLSFAAAMISLKWHSIMKSSLEWIDFWYSKIIYFEKHQAPGGQAYFFFLDREMTEPEKLDTGKKPFSFKEKRIEKINKALKKRWSFPPEDVGGIGNDMIQIATIVTIIWIVSTAFSLVLDLCGTTLCTCPRLAFIVREINVWRMGAFFLTALLFFSLFFHYLRK